MTYSADGVKTTVGAAIDEIMQLTTEEKNIVLGMVIGLNIARDSRSKKDDAEHAEKKTV